MKYTRSGEYKLPGPAYRFTGNVALRMVRWIPVRMRDSFVKSRSHYQGFSPSDINADHQGLSVKKLEAMQLPADLKGKSVLDLGCSEGFFSQQCARRGAAKVLGIDSNLGRLLCASSIALNQGLKVRYKVGIFPEGVSGKFDYVLCLSVLHHSLSKKDVWKVLSSDEHAADLVILRRQLSLLRSFTADGGRCIIEMPYEYDDPEAERTEVDFGLFQNELAKAGFKRSTNLGTWDYNPDHRLRKDRIIYVAEV